MTQINGCALKFKICNKMITAACCEAEADIEAEAIIDEDALTSLLLLASTVIEVILRSLDIEDISAFPASMIEVLVPPEGAEAG